MEPIYVSVCIHEHPTSGNPIVTTNVIREEAYAQAIEKDRNLTLLKIAQCLEKWMKQDIGKEDTIEFWSLYHERQRQLGQLIRSMPLPIGERHQIDTPVE